MEEGQEDQLRILRVLLRFGSGVLMAGLAGSVAELSYLKTISEVSATGHHPSTFAAWMLFVSWPIVQFLQSKSLWEAIPAFQIGTPFSASNVPFWISIFILVRVVRSVVHWLEGERDGGHVSRNTLWSEWKNHLLHPGPVNNYMVMINGPVTNSVAAQTVGEVTQEALPFSSRMAEPEGIADDLNRLLRAITTERELPGDQRREALDLIHAIADEAKRPEKERKPAVIKAILNALPVAISTAKSLADLWIEIQPHVASFFL